MAIPKYQKIKNILTMRLNAGEFRPGDRFYTESELSDCFHVSSITAIRALNELANEGYLTRIQGKGTFVEQTQLDHNLRVNFSDDLARTEKPQASEIIAISEASDQYYRDKLAMTANQRDYYCVEVIRYCENEPYSFECHYIRPEVLTATLRNTVRQQALPFRLPLSNERLQLPDEELFKETDEIVFPLPERIAHYLQLPSSEPAALQLCTTYTAQYGHPIRYIECYKKWYDYKIAIAN